MANRQTPRWPTLKPPRERESMAECAPIVARYSAAEDPDDMAAHWGHADALDADASNSYGVRRKLRNRARLERANNGYSCGAIRTHKNYVVGKGPRLRMQTKSTGFNAMVEAKWAAWCNASHFARKLRTMFLAKTGDGEGFAQIKNNPSLADEVKLDLHELECDQFTTPFLPWAEPYHVDGVWFDECGNPTAYDLLPYHPGGLWTQGLLYSWKPMKVPAKWIVHWFEHERPGQHRGVPKSTSTLNLFAQSRRFREAVLAAAETAADHSAVLEMPAVNGEVDQVAPFATMPIEKRMFVATPAGAKFGQMRAEQPAATFDGYNRATISEEARPYSMSYSIAACDSSGNSFSGTRNDHLIYYMEVETERQDAEEMVCDPVFSAWFQEAALVYGWAVDATTTPAHAWDWPPMPETNRADAATSAKTELGSGATTLSLLYAKSGEDFDGEVLPRMARDFGVTEDEMRRVLMRTIFAPAFQGQGGGGQPATNGQANGRPAGNKFASDIPASIARRMDGHAIDAFSANHDALGRFCENSSAEAWNASRVAYQSGNEFHHQAAADAHYRAYEMHAQRADVAIATGHGAAADRHQQNSQRHFSKSLEHRTEAEAARIPVYYSAARRVSLNPRTNAGRAILEHAAREGVEPEHLAEAAQFIHEEKANMARDREAAKLHARQLTGLTAGDLSLHENKRGGDYSSVKTRGMPFDVAAVEIARHYPGMMGDADGNGDLAAGLWDLMREGKQRIPQPHDPEILREAAKLVQHAREQGEYEQQLEYAEF